MKLLALTSLLLLSGAARADVKLWVSATHHEGDVPFSVQNTHAFIDGNTLWSFCQDSAQLKSCLNYIIGVADVLMTQNTNTMCLPGNAIEGQLMDVVKKYLSDHPETRQFTAMSEVQVALQNAFPCSRVPK